MPVEVIMPKVDMDMDRGRIVAWHVAEGAPVDKGDALFDIETDKAAMEVEAPAAGRLHHRAAEGSEIPIGKPVAWLYEDGEAIGPAPTDAADDKPADASGDPDETSQQVKGATTPAQPPPEGTAEAMPDAAPRATPAARARARETGVDLGAVAGAGPRGRVQLADIEAAITNAPPVGARACAALAVSRRGSGSGVPLVLLHGFASDMTSWAPLEEHLGDRPVIRIDLPGHGRSPPLQEHGFAALVGSVRSAFDDLEVAHAHLVGHSLGGALALALADTRPRQVAKLTLIAPAGLGPQIDGAALAGLCRATRAESLAPWLRMLVADPLRITDSYARLAMQSRADPALRTAQTAMADALFPDGTQGFDLTAALDRLVPPARIIWGKADAIVPWTHALRAPGRVGLHLFDRVGHMPQIECAEEVGKILSEPL
jgi:pyruvate dehydrogenase E2 component (dihydrolipoamide acetyltransferase)